jgi:hypothetical protein
MRDIIFMLSIRDAITATILTADMNATALMKALGTIAAEHDTMESHLLHKRQAPDYAYKFLSVGAKEPQPVFPHVSHFIAFCDRLREFRNFYVHGIITPDPKGGAIARSTSARGKLSFYRESISVSDLESLTERIATCVAYGTNVCTVIGQISAYSSDKDAVPPIWPEKPRLPNSMARRRRGLLDE